MLTRAGNEIKLMEKTPVKKKVQLQAINIYHHAAYGVFFFSLFSPSF
jgi:hypothetical protein